MHRNVSNIGRNPIASSFVFVKNSCKLNKGWLAWIISEKSCLPRKCAEAGGCQVVISDPQGPVAGSVLAGRGCEGWWSAGQCPAHCPLNRPPCRPHFIPGVDVIPSKGLKYIFGLMLTRAMKFSHMIIYPVCIHAVHCNALLGSPLKFNM